MIAITGANGFVGKCLTKCLQSAGLETCGFVRESPIPGQIACGPIEARTEWASLLTGVDILVHTAARVHRMDDPPAVAEREASLVNHLATVELACQAADVGVKRFIFLSTVKVLGESTRIDEPFSHTSRAHPQDAYARSKWAAEQALSTLSRETGMEVVIVRPPLVYGPGVKGNFLQLIRLVNKGIPLPFKIIKNRRSIVAVDNLCDLLLSCCRHEAAAGKTFLVSDEFSLSTAELVRNIAEGMSKPARLLPIPVSILKFLGKLTGRYDQVARLTDSLEVDMSYTMTTLNWRPPVATADAIKATVDAILSDIP